MEQKFSVLPNTRTLVGNLHRKEDSLAFKKYLYSYDIFDTVLYRGVPKPTDIFYIMEENPLLHQYWPSKMGSFATFRRRCEFWLRRLSKTEINIEDIYNTIAKKSKLDIKIINRIKQLELTVEKEHSFLHIPTVESIKQHLKKQEPVVLISDMYWPAEQLSAWLAEKDPIFANIPVYVSCDQGVTKTSGKLFERVSQLEKIKYFNWQHTGDNCKSDGIVPRKLGINTTMVRSGALYRFESKIPPTNSAQREVYELICKLRTSTKAKPAFELGVSIAAPMIYQYIDWVLKQAVEKQIKTLYFVLRDGYIPKMVADEIISARNLPLRTEYVFGSRVAWRLPEVSIDKLKNLSVWDKSNWIFRDIAIAYVPFERLGFTKAELDDLMGSSFGKRVLYTFKEFKQTLEQALDKPAFAEKLILKVKEGGENLDSYLYQTVDWSEKFAFVDTNSTGKTQCDLNFFIQKRHSECSNIPFFYHTWLGEQEPNELNQFVFIKASQADQRLPEVFFRAPYNPCYGYKKTQKGITPKFHQSKYCAWKGSFDYEEYLQGILAFTKAQEKRKLNLDSYVTLLCKVVNFTIFSPDVTVQLAKIPFHPDLQGDETLDFYPAIEFSALFHPFSKLIYYPKGSYYINGIWRYLYPVLWFLTQMKRRLKHKCKKDYHA